MVKKTFNRLLSILLCMMMLLSTLPMSVFAEGEAATTTDPVVDGTYTGENWAEGGNGTITHKINGTDVSLSKTAVPAKDEKGEVIENTFDITLQVQTSTVTTQRTDGGAVVLVIDVSGSMDYCAECGGERSHDDDCKYYSRGNNGVTTAQSRLAATKTAALAFLQSYAGTDSSANRQIALVKFSTTGSPVNFGNRWGGSVYWVNVAGGASGSNAANYTRVVNAINRLSAGGGTNLDDGLYEAYNLLDDVNALEKNVIALTDGVPTYRGHTNNPSGLGSSGSSQNNSAAAAQATNIKKAGADLYTVCFGVADEETYEDGPTVGDFLSGSVASSGCAYNADNTAELNEAFKAITENITSGLSGQGWTATDPMADKIDLVSGASSSFVAGDNESYTWTLSDPVVSEEDANGVTTYTYTYTYRVKLDVQSVGFGEGTYYPTNKETYLKIENQQYAFPVPGVTGVLPRTSVTVEKEWVDDDNRDKMRTDSVTVQLYDTYQKNGESVTDPVGNPVVLSATNNWTNTWNDVIAKSENVDHVYSVVETEVPKGYEPEYTVEDGKLIVTNKHEIQKTNVTVKKVWDDANNQDGIRESVQIQLYANNRVYGNPVTLTGEGIEGNEWTYTFTGLPLNENGVQITYTAKEVGSVVGYNKTENGLTITNTHTPATTDITVTKVWDDASNQDGLRKDIKIQLFANGNPKGDAVPIPVPTNGKNEVTWVYEDLPVYENGGKPIVYTVDEVETTEGYSKNVTGTAKDGFVITNTHTPSTITISGEKIWKDSGDADGMRPDSITVELLAGSEVITSATVKADAEWKYSFTDLPEYKTGAVGEKIQYSIREVAVPQYITTYNGNNIINTYAPDKVSVTVTKVWEDANNQDGKRHEEVKIKLLENGKETGKQLILNKDNWTGSFTDLTKYKNNKEVVYTVEEVLPDNTYTSVVTGDQTNGFIITNSYTPETTSVSGTKTWVDNDNQDGVRPESITINLLAGGEIIKTVKVGEAEKWAWSFTDLPKYDKGTEIVYSVTEEAVEDYSATYSEEGYDVTNTHTPAQTSVTVTKAWEDNNDQDGIRPDEITVVLLANGEASDKTLVLNAKNKWTGSFTDLDKFDKGEEIEYTVAELKVEGYETEITGDATKGFIITNTHEPEKTVVAGKKTWDDNNNQDGKRPEVIEINVLGNGVLLETVKITEADGWAWSFNLPKYVNGGQEVAYAVTENAVEGYTATYEGYNVINSYTPEEIGFTVSKVWADSDDAEGIRPDEVEIKLFANGEDTGILLVVSEEGKWVADINGLPKYYNGEEIEYTVEEVAVKGYNTVIKGDVEKGFTVTNSHTYIPDTGDNRTPILWGSLMAGAILTAGAVVFSKKRKNEEK